MLLLGMEVLSGEWQQVSSREMGGLLIVEIVEYVRDIHGALF